MYLLYIDIYTYNIYVYRYIYIYLLSFCSQLDSCSKLFRRDSRRLEFLLALGSEDFDNFSLAIGQPSIQSDIHRASVYIYFFFIYVYIYISPSSLPSFPDAVLIPSNFSSR